MNSVIPKPEKSKGTRDEVKNQGKQGAMATTSVMSYSLSPLVLGPMMARKSWQVMVRSL